MKYLNDTGTAYLIKKLNARDVKLSSVEYRYVTTERAIFSFTIPSYDNKFVVEVYINGIRCIEDIHYTLTSQGIVSTINTIDGGSEMLFIVKKADVSGVKLSSVQYRYINDSEGIKSFNIPSYDEKCDVELYISGLKCANNYDYTLSSSGVVTTLKSIDIGAEMLFVVNKIVED